MSVGHCAKVYTAEEVDLRKYLVELDEPFSKISEGAYGEVYKSKLNGANCVVKKLHDILTGMGGQDYVSENEWRELVAKFQREIELLSQQRHPNIVQFLGVCGGLGGDPRNICLVMEQLDTDLKGFIEANKGSISFPLKLRILRDVSCGVGHLHAKNIVHRDLNARNVLLTSSLQAKVADLGVSRVIESRPQYLTNLSRVPGALDYMPPEVIQSIPVYGTKMDSFSFGHLALYLIIERYPNVNELHSADIDLRTRQDGRLLIGVQIQKRKQWIALLNKEEKYHSVESLITACLDDSEGKRPSMRELREQLEAMMSRHESVPSMMELKLMNTEKHCKIEQLTTEMEKKIQEMTQLETMKDKEVSQLAEKFQRINEELRRTIEKRNHHKAILSGLQEERKSLLLFTGKASLEETRVMFEKMKKANQQMKDVIASGQQQMRSYKQEIDDLKWKLREAKELVCNKLQDLSKELEYSGILQVQDVTQLQAVGVLKESTSADDLFKIDFDEFEVDEDDNAKMALPDHATQKEEIEALLQQKLELGDAWYLIDQRWFTQWHDFEDQRNAGSESVIPGPVDNSNLLKDAANDILKDHLQQDVHYSLIPKPAWEKFVLWYSMTPQSQPICRRVIVNDSERLEVGVYIGSVKASVCVHPHISSTKQLTLNKAETIKIVHNKLRKLFEISDDSETRLRLHSKKNSYKLMENPDQSLAEVHDGHQQLILMLEVKNKGGKWPRDRYPGLCGLSNLGNTCFMNSALQCLSNTKSLTEYFLGEDGMGEKSFKKRINKDSLAWGMVETYGDLLNKMWSGSITCLAPHEFKEMVYKYAPKFSEDLVQHDAHELLLSILDGLHDGLNSKKQAGNTDVKKEGKEDKKIAEEVWQKCMSRNQSVVVRLFLGQLRLMLDCPKCQKMSRSFDLFRSMSLPLPNKKFRNIFVKLVHVDPLKEVVRYCLAVPEDGSILQLKLAMQELTGIDPKKLMVTDVCQSRFYKVYSNSDAISSEIKDYSDIFLYELSKSLEDDNWIPIAVYMREVFKVQKLHSNAAEMTATTCKDMFGLPIVVTIPREGCTYRQLYYTILVQCQRYVTEPTVKPKKANEFNDSQNGTENGIEIKANEESNSHNLFKLIVVNAHGSHELQTLEDTDLNLELTSHCSQTEGQIYVSCDWAVETKEKYYDVKKAEEFIADVSCNEKMEKKKSIDIYADCFDLFTFEREDTWNCPHCKQDVAKATKKFDIWKLPEVLVIHLERFPDPELQESKNNLKVRFPLTGLDLSKYVVNKDKDQEKPIYDLFAVSNHFGEKGRGHYTAYCKIEIEIEKENKKIKTEKWYSFDDDEVSEIDESLVCSSSSYILFYARQSGP